MTKKSNNTIDNFAHVYPSYLDAMVHLLIGLRQEFDGDLDKALIMAVIGDRHFANRVSLRAPTFASLGATPTTDGPSVNALSIAQFTDIPRETVRRKVAMLVDLGWVNCDDRGNLSPTQQAAADLSNGTNATVKFIETVALASRSQA